jgi:predicted  nucleic acid-binding Zn-ribbon protein
MRERRKDYEKDLTSIRLELESQIHSLTENLTSAEERKKALTEDLARITTERDKLKDKLRDTLEKQHVFTEKANKHKVDLGNARKEIKNLEKVGKEDKQTIVISSSIQKITVD